MKLKLPISYYCSVRDDGEIDRSLPGLKKIQILQIYLVGAVPCILPYTVKK